MIYKFNTTNRKEQRLYLIKPLEFMARYTKKIQRCYCWEMDVEMYYFYYYYDYYCTNMMDMMKITEKL